MRVLFIICASIAFAATLAPAHAAHRHPRRLPPVKTYTRQLAARAGWTGPEWRALDSVVTPESGWNPCAYYPSRSDCRYGGSSSCGIPQAQPCPSAWRGRLWASRFAQARWLIRYVRSRYGRPSAALAFRRGHGWY